MTMILLVVVGAINQSKYVAMMSLAVVGTLTNQILCVYMGVYMEVCVGLHGSMRRSMQRSMQRSTWVYASLCGVYAEVYAGLCRGIRGSTWV